MADSDGKPKENLSMAVAAPISFGIGGVVQGMLYRQMVANNTPTLFGVPIGEPDSGDKWSMFFWAGAGGLFTAWMIYLCLQFVYGLTRK